MKTAPRAENKANISPERRVNALKKAAAILVCICFALVLVSAMLVSPPTGRKYADYRTKQGLEALKNSDYQSAERFFRSAQRTRPEGATASMALSLLYRRRGREDLARKALEQAAAAQTRSPEIYLTLCTLYVQQGRLAEAAALLDRVNNQYVRQRIAAVRPQPPEPYPRPGPHEAGTKLGFFTRPGTAIYYTLTGEAPTLQTPYQNETLPLRAHATLRAVAVKDGIASSMLWEEYTVR